MGVEVLGEVVTRVGPQSPAEPRTPAVVAVAIPCYNEAATIGKVIRDFRRLLPEAIIWVCDNASTDGSAEAARAAGAVVVREHRRGKGYAIQTILATVEADALVIVDGDGTYVAEDVQNLVAPVLKGEADMVVGNRIHGAPPEAMRQLHQVGNRWLVAMLNMLFSTSFQDVLSVYRVFSRRFQRGVPVLTAGFEVETELTIQALKAGMVIQEVPIGYQARLPGSTSKLRSFRDGYRIAMTMIILLRDHRPLVVFGTFGLCCFLVASVAGLLRILGARGWPALPSSTLSAVSTLGVIVGFSAVGVGLLLNAMNTRFRELACLLKRRGDHA